jgi:predicted flavoprotein YhiN
VASTADSDARTLEARNVPGLIFVGEVVDVTGRLAAIVERSREA